MGDDSVIVEKRRQWKAWRKDGRKLDYLVAKCFSKKTVHVADKKAELVSFQMLRN